MRHLVASTLVVVVGVGCGGGVTPLELVESGDGTVILLTTCTDESAAAPAASVEESPTEIRITDIDGTPSPGDDCQGSVELPLIEPIGDRTVVVNRTTWPRVDDDCARARFASPDWIAQLGWELPLSCDS